MIHFTHLVSSLNIPVAVEIRLLHSQSFTNSHFHFLIIVEPATFQVLLQRPKQMDCLKV
jgi:hypothetical protein